jgi:hypothetical protein
MSRKRFAFVALAALLLPGALILASDGFVILAASSWDVVGFVLLNWALLVSPQLFVLLLALVFPRLRYRFAPIALAALTILVVLFEGVVFWFSDANGPMWFAFYFPLSLLALVLVAIASLPQATHK